jgi:hypothetical protein
MNTKIRTAVMALSLIALMAPASQAAPAKDKAQDCREQVGKETTEGEGRSHIGRLQAQRFSDCMMGMQH